MKMARMTKDPSTEGEHAKTAITVNNFLVPMDTEPMVNLLTDQQAGKLFKAFFAVHRDQDPVIDDPMVNLALSSFKPIFSKNGNRYIQKSLSGKLGNLKRWNEDLYKRVEAGQMTIDDAEFEAEVRKAAKKGKNNGATECDSHGVARVANIDIGINTPIDTNIPTGMSKGNAGGATSPEPIKEIPINNLMEQCLSDVEFHNKMAGKFNLSQPLITQWIRDFTRWQQGQGNNHKTYPDFKDHFMRWLGKQPNLNSPYGIRQKEPAMTFESIADNNHRIMTKYARQNT